MKSAGQSHVGRVVQMDSPDEESSYKCDQRDIHGSKKVDIKIINNSDHFRVT